MPFDCLTCPVHGCTTSRTLRRCRRRYWECSLKYLICSLLARHCVNLGPCLLRQLTCWHDRSVASSASSRRIRWFIFGRMCSVTLAGHFISINPLSVFTKSLLTGLLLSVASVCPLFRVRNLCPPVASITWNCPLSWLHFKTKIAVAMAPCRERCSLRMPSPISAAELIYFIGLVKHRQRAPTSPFPWCKVRVHALINCLFINELFRLNVCHTILAGLLAECTPLPKAAGPTGFSDPRHLAYFPSLCLPQR